MGLNGGNLGFGFILWAKDLASGVLNDVERKVVGLDAATQGSAKHIGASFKEIATAAATLTASLAPLGVAVASAFAAGEFTQGLAAVGAATGATAKEMQGLHDAALAAGVATQYSPADAVQGLVTLATAGQTATQAMQTLRHSLDLAAASLGQLTVSQASDALGGTMTAWSMSTDKAGEVADKLVQATMLTNFAAADFSVGLSRVAEAGARYNQSLDDVIIGMGLLRNRNINAEVAATALRAAITRVNTDLDAQRALLSLNIPLLDQYGKERPILNVIDELAKATGNLSPLKRNVMIKQIFGEEGMPAFASIASAAFTTVENGTSITYRGAQAIEALRRELGQAEGAAANFAKRYNDNFQGKMVLLRGSLQALGVTIGEVFGQVLAPVMDKVTGALNALLNVLMAMPMPFKEAAAGGFLLASALVAINGAALALRPTLGALRWAWTATRGAVVSLVSAMVAAIATPIGAAIAAAVAALGLLYVAYRNNVGGMATLAGAGPGRHVIAFLRGLSQLLDDGSLHGDALEALGASPALKRFTLGIYSALNAMRALWDGVRNGFGAALTTLSGSFTWLGGALGSTGESLINLFGAVGRLLRVTGLIAKPFLYLVGGFIGIVFGALTAAVGALAAGLTNIVDFVLFLVDLLLLSEDVWGEFFAFLKPAFEPIGSAMAALWDLAGAQAFCDAIVHMIPAALRRAVAAAWEFIRRPFGHPLTDGALYDAPSVSAVPPAATAAAQPLASPSASTQAYPAAAQVQAWRATAQSQAALQQGSTGTTTATLEHQTPISVAVQIDGETVARAVARAQTQQAGRQYAPVRAY